MQPRNNNEIILDAFYRISDVSESIQTLFQKDWRDFSSDCFDELIQYLNSDDAKNLISERKNQQPDSEWFVEGENLVNHLNNTGYSEHNFAILLHHCHSGVLEDPFFGEYMRIRNGFKIKVEEKRMNREKEIYGNVKSDVKCPTCSIPMYIDDSENPQGAVPGFWCKQCDAFANYLS